MAGYTPVFDSIYDGSLYGRWPAAAVWATLLPMFDHNGELDMSYERICGCSGWPRDLLEEGIRQLMEPDPTSRSPRDDGRRLVPLDPARPWGWRAVNHGKYREKARLMNKNARDVESGKEAARKRRSRRKKRPPKSAAVRQSPPSPPMSPSHTHTQTQTQTKSKKKNPSLTLEESLPTVLLGGVEGGDRTIEKQSPEIRRAAVDALVHDVFKRRA